METLDTPMPAAAYQRRSMDAKWVKKLFRDLSPDEIDCIKRCLGRLPLEPSVGTVDELWERVTRNEVGFYVLPVGETSALQAITFYEVMQLRDGSRQFESLCTVSIGPSGLGLAAMDMHVMEQLARDLGCQSMAMQTIRPGLVEVLTKKHGWFPASITLRKILK